MWSNKILKKIFDRTKGHCHFCGDKVIFENYGLKNADNVSGMWEADHILQKGKGGVTRQDNCLSACWKCNRLRWHRKGRDIRELISLGLIAKDEIKKKTSVGKRLEGLKENRKLKNKKRRRERVS